MRLTSEATTVWNGDLKTGAGSVTLDSSKAAEFPVTWAARTTGEAGRTNPEELLSAAHAACFAMQFSSLLAKFGTPPQTLTVTAAIGFEAVAGITGSHLTVKASVPGISDEDFQSIAAEARAGCPVSRALVGIPITLDAQLA
jgi:osmotically inducible protein OsmC